MRPRLLPFLFLVLLPPAAALDGFSYVSSLPQEEGLVVVDARPAAECAARTLAGARCLPAEDFLGPHHRLPDARNLLWLLGTAGLSGEEAVLVTGQEATARDFVAGLLYVAGQRSVRVLTEPVGRLLEQGAAAAPGRGRAMVRETVFTAPMRDAVLLLRDELWRQLHTTGAVLLDGRTEAEYWGETVRAARGGHLPGAVSLPAARLRAALAAPPPPLPEGEGIAYGHDAFEGFAYFTLLAAGFGLPVRLYAEGWAEWAADARLPADAVSYPDRAQAAARKSQSPLDGGARPPALLAVTLALAATAFAAGWALRSRRAPPPAPQGSGRGRAGAA